MTYRSSTWFHPDLTARASAIHGHGLFTTSLIGAGEVVMIWGGDVYSRDDLERGRVPSPCSYSFIDEGLLMAGPEDGMDYYVNHSCDPTVWMADNVTVVARRDLPKGTEITGDYAVWEADSSYLIAACRCGSPQCRSRVCGDDWQRPELQERYSGHFLPYISRRIAAL